MNEPFVHKGKTLLSGIEPVRRAEKATDAVSIKDRTLYFCPSPIFGYGLARLLERLENEAPSSAILCVEADSELFKISQNKIDPSLAKNKMYCLTNICDSNKLYDLINTQWGALSFRRIEILKFTGGYQLFPDLYDALCDTLRRGIAADWSNALTLAKLGRLYIKNLLRNIPLSLEFPSLSDLSFGDEPILVLGAGPSLDETLDALQITENRAQRSFKIICVDTCLGALKDRGIEPDLVVILESQHWNIRDFIGIKGWNVPAAVDLSSLPATAKLLGGEGFLFFTPWTRLKIFERLKDAGLLPAVFPPLGSVGLTAVEIARRLTSGKLVLAGLDFSFTMDKYHACGTPGHRGKLSLQTRLLRLFNIAAFNESSVAAVSNSGQSVYTNPIMKNYRNLFEQEFGSDERIYSIKSTGLPLGVKTISIEEVHTKAQRNKRHEEEKEEEIIRVVRGKEKLNKFLEEERKRLDELRSILTGEAEANRERLNLLITECDYLWAHFPDYAGGADCCARQPDINDSSFLNRVRIEIDIMSKLI